MKFKDDTSTSLSGIHTAIIAYCENKQCNADQIVWISEYFEKPLYEQAVAQLYEIKWDFFDVDSRTRLLCKSCATLYRSEQQQDASEFTTVELGGLVKQTEEQRRDAARANCE